MNKIFILLLLVIAPVYLFWETSDRQRWEEKRVRYNLAGGEYMFPWPGILPDSRLYKLKVLRNKIIYKLIINSDKRVEFDRMMADKTLYASKLLFDKGKTQLAVDTALKGENYMSMLVSDYGKVLNEKKSTDEIDRRIETSQVVQEALVHYLVTHSSGPENVSLRQVEYFSKANYGAFQNLLHEKTNKIH